MLASSFCLLLATVAVSAQTVPTTCSERECLPLKWESSVYGKRAVVVQGTGVVADVVATAAVDYTNNQASFRQSVYVDGEFAGNFTLLFFSVSTWI